MNKITIELCQEDRERIDRLTVALENRVAQVEKTLALYADEDAEAADIQKALAEQVAKASKAPTETPTESHENAPEATEAETAPTERPEPETAATVEPTPKAEAKPAPTPAALQQKVIELVNAAKQVSGDHAKAVKAKITAIVNDYAVAVSKIPEDKRAEAMERMNALEV